MKNTKKILCLTLSLAVVLTMAFAFVACDPEQPEEPEMTYAQKEQLRAELISDSTPNLTRAETTMEKVDESNGTISQVSITWDMGNAEARSTPVLNADIIFMQYSPNSDEPISVNVAFIRGNNVYGQQVALELVGSDKLAAAKNKMAELVAGVEPKTLEELITELSAKTGVDFSALGNVDLSNANLQIDTEQFVSFLKEYFTTLTVTDDGYTVAFDFDKVVAKIWKALYSAAETIDNNRNFALYTLYNNSVTRKAINKVPLTAAEMETVINQGIAEINKQMPAEKQLNVTALVAEKDETLYHYLGRYLAIKIDTNKTVGDMTVGDLLCIIAQSSTAPDLTDELTKKEAQIENMLKSKLTGITFELKFSKNKQFEGVIFNTADGVSININPVLSPSLAEIAA